MERRYWLIVVALVLAAAGSEFLLWINRAPFSDQTFAGPPRSDYTLNDFTLDALDTLGRRTFQVSGPHLARRAEDGSIFVTTPDYVIIDGNDHPWHGKSDAAWVNKEGTLMMLQGHVEMHRDASADTKAIDIVTSDLTTWPKTKKMETAALATITQTGSILRGTGMRGDLNSKVLELLADVHAIVQPKHDVPDAAK